MDENKDYVQGKALIDFLNDQTFETIQDRLLQAFPDEYDKREGSIAWDIFAPFSIEERLVFLQILWIWKNMFADTADRQSLIRLAKMRNVEILPATPAIVEGKFNREIPQGSRFNYEAINFAIQDPITKEEDDGYYYYSLQCETTGEAGNVYGVDITPMDNIDGLTYAKITRVLIPGEEEEDTEALRSRYYESIRQRDYGFNISQYVHEVERMPGVGFVRCYPATPKAGHVTLYITDSAGLPPSHELVNKVQETLDPHGSEQKGVGLAPIGHFVHVMGAVKDDIDIAVKITYHGTLGEGEKKEIEKRVAGYLKDLRETYSKTYSGNHPTLDTRLIVRESYVETSILAANAILGGKIIDVNVETINGKEGNYELKDNALPVLGTITYKEG